MLRMPQGTITPDTDNQVRGDWVTFRQRDFTGGESKAALPEMIGRNQLQRFENAMIYTDGTITAALQMNTAVIQDAVIGFALVPNTTANFVVDGSGNYILDSNGDYIISGPVASDYTYYYAPGDSKVYTGTLDTSDTTPIGLSSGTQHALNYSFIKGMNLGVYFLGKFYCPNPHPDTTKNGIINLTDLSIVLIPNKKTVKLRVYMNRLWVVNDDGSVYCSDNGDATTFDVLNNFWLPNQEPAIDFVPVQGGAIVYSQTTIYAMYGSDYKDIRFEPLLADQMLTSGAVRVKNTVYIVSCDSVIEADLNGAQPIPHNQHEYFRTNYSVFALPSYMQTIVQGVYVKRIRAIYFTWATGYGGDQSFLFYTDSNSFTKINQLLPDAYPHILGLNDCNTDFLIGLDHGLVGKTGYSETVPLVSRLACLQTRHEDCDSNKNKVWKELVITTDINSSPLSGVNIDAFLDYSDTAQNIATDEILFPGENVIRLDSLPYSKSISCLIQIDNTQIADITDDSGVYDLTTDSGLDDLTADSVQSEFRIRELGIKTRFLEH